MPCATTCWCPCLPFISFNFSPLLKPSAVVCFLLCLTISLRRCPWHLPFLGQMTDGDVFLSKTVLTLPTALKTHHLVHTPLSWDTEKSKSTPGAPSSAPPAARLRADLGAAGVDLSGSRPLWAASWQPASSPFWQRAICQSIVDEQGLGRRQN